jgi:hypothetical protein
LIPQHNKVHDLVKTTYRYHFKSSAMEGLEFTNNGILVSEQFHHRHHKFVIIFTSYLYDTKRTSVKILFSYCVWPDDSPVEIRKDRNMLSSTWLPPLLCFWLTFLHNLWYLWLHTPGMNHLKIDQIHDYTKFTKI